MKRWRESKPTHKCVYCNQATFNPEFDSCCGEQHFEKVRYDMNKWKYTRYLYDIEKGIDFSISVEIDANTEKEALAVGFKKLNDAYQIEGTMKDKGYEIKYLGRVKEAA